MCKAMKRVRGKFVACCLHDLTKRDVLCLCHCQQFVDVIWLLSLVYDSFHAMLRNTDMELSIVVVV